MMEISPAYLTTGETMRKLLILGLLVLASAVPGDRKSTRLNSSHSSISYAVFCLKKKTIRALAPLVEGRILESFTEDMCTFWRHVTGDSQLRWVGPEKGVIHLATSAIVNAVWDLYAKSERKPLWRLLSDMSPEELISCIDFRYITDAITREEALEILFCNWYAKPRHLHSFPTRRSSD